MIQNEDVSPLFCQFCTLAPAQTPESQVVSHWLMLLSSSHNPIGTKLLRLSDRADFHWGEGSSLASLVTQAESTWTCRDRQVPRDQPCFISNNRLFGDSNVKYTVNLHPRSSRDKFIKGFRTILFNNYMLNRVGHSRVHEISVFSS